MAGPYPRDRIRETTTTTGTGTLSLAGAVSGFHAFVSRYATGDIVHYAVVHRTADEWEVSEGVFTDATPDTITRGLLFDSSTGSAVNFSAGTKDVFICDPARRLNRQAAVVSGPLAKLENASATVNTAYTVDGVLQLVGSLTLSSASTQFVWQQLLAQFTNTLTGGVSITHCRLADLQYTGSTGSDVTNFTGVYISTTMNGTASGTNGIGLYVDSLPGANRAGYAVASLHTGATKSALMMLGSGDLANDLGAGHWSLYSPSVKPSYFAGSVQHNCASTTNESVIYSTLLYSGTGFSNYVQNRSFCTYTPTTFSNPFVIGHYGYHHTTLYGDQGGVGLSPTAATGSAIGYCTSLLIKDTSQYESEHAPVQFQISYDNNNNAFGNTTPGRGWLADLNMFSAVSTQQSAFGGVHMFMNNYYNGPPRDALSVAYAAVTNAGSGAATDDYHNFSPTYQMGYGFAVSGFTNGGVSRAFESAFAAGISGTNWQLPADSVHIGAGFDADNYDYTAMIARGRFRGVIQVYLTNAGSGYTTPPGVAFSGGGATSQALALAELVATTVSRTASTNLVTTGGSGYSASQKVRVTYSDPTPWGAPAVGYLQAAAGGTVAVNDPVIFGNNATCTITTSGGAVTAVGTFAGTNNNYPPSETALPVVLAQSSNRTAWGTATTNSSGAITAVSVQTVIGIGSGYTNGSGVVIETTGTGYTRLPSASVAASPSGDTPIVGTVVLQATSIGLVKLASVGLGYTSQPTIAFSGGGGTGAAAIATVLAMNPLAEIRVVTAGSGYAPQALPAVTIGTTSATGGLTTGTGPTPTATVTSGVITALGGTATGGSGFLPSQSPGFLVRLVGQTSAARNATALITTNASGGVATASVVSGGSGYTSGETLNYVGYVDVVACVPDGFLTNFVITNMGAGFVKAPTITVAAPSPTTATGTATVSGGAVTAVVMTNKGNAYWNNVPTVTFNDPGSGTETGARGNAVVYFGQVDRVDMLFGGTGYTGTTTVTFSAPPSGTTATAVAPGRFGGFALVTGPDSGDVNINDKLRVDSLGNINNANFLDSTHGMLRHYEVVTSAAATLTTILGVARTVTSAVAATNQKTTLGEWLRISATANNADSSLAAATFTLTQTNFGAVLVTRVQIPTAIVNMRVFIGLFSAAAVMTTDTQSTIHSVYFRFSTGATDTTWKCCTSNATSTTVLDSGVTVAINTRYDLKIDCTDTANLRFYINGALVATGTATLPTSSTNLGPGHYLRSLSASGQKDLDTGFTAIYQ